MKGLLLLVLFKSSQSLACAVDNENFEKFTSFVTDIGFISEVSGFSSNVEQNENTEVIRQHSNSGHLLHYKFMKLQTPVQLLQFSWMLEFYRFLETNFDVGQQLACYQNERGGYLIAHYPFKVSPYNYLFYQLDPLTSSKWFFDQITRIFTYVENRGGMISSLERKDFFWIKSNPKTFIIANFKGIEAGTLDSKLLKKQLDDAGKISYGFNCVYLNFLRGVLLINLQNEHITVEEEKFGLQLLRRILSLRNNNYLVDVIGDQIRSMFPREPSPNAFLLASSVSRSSI